MSAHRHRLYFRLQRTAHILKKAADRRLIEAAGITTAQAAALAVIASEHQGVTQKHVAEQLGQNESAITAMVARLEKLGYAKRQRHPDDARARVLRVTAKGEEALDAMTGPFRSVNRRLDKALVDHSAEEMAAMLDSIANAFKDDG